MLINYKKTCIVVEINMCFSLVGMNLIFIGNYWQIETFLIIQQEIKNRDTKFGHQII